MIGVETPFHIGDSILVVVQFRFATEVSLLHMSPWNHQLLPGRIGADKSQANAIVASIILSKMKCVQKAVVDRGQDDGHQRQEDEAAEETVERREELS